LKRLWLNRDPHTHPYVLYRIGCRDSPGLSSGKAARQA